MNKTYIATEVQRILDLHPFLATPAFKTSTIGAQISQLARSLHTAHAAGDRRIAMQIFWWPEAKGQTLDEVLATPFSADAALLTVSREHGFLNWAAVQELGDQALDVPFEQALDAMVAADIEALDRLLTATPKLATAQSKLGHQATLLHYLGANGVESHRQQTPMNAVEMARLLISKGADRRAQANMYGGGQTAFDLASTSAHPHRAGIGAALNQLLEPV